jgi:hypothetical protein
MDIDMAALRGLEREKEIPFEVVVEAIEQACWWPTSAATTPRRTRGSSSTGAPVT